MICSDEVENENAFSEAITAWFPKSVCFLRICIETEALSTEMNNFRPDMSSRPSHIQTELCFVQFYAIFGTYKIVIDAIDKAVGCFSLCWHRVDTEEERYSASKLLWDCLCQKFTCACPLRTCGRCPHSSRVERLAKKTV